jgi:hypothetical protein
MSARAACFPLSASPRDGRHPIGTGFLLMKERRLFLVTAAHVPLEAQPTDDWSAWPAELLIFRQDRALTVPLFRGLPVGRVPRFIYVGRGGGFIQDFLAMEFGLDALAAGNVFEGFATVDAASMRFASPGEMVRGFGYPLLGEKWPSSEVDAIQGLFRGYEGVLAEADAPVHKWHSGGPVFRADGAWIGMTIGRTEKPDGSEPAIIVPACWILGQL